MKLIAIRVTGASNGTGNSGTKGHCSYCGAEVYVTADSHRLLREYDMPIICTGCFYGLGTPQECTGLRGELRELCR